MSIEVGNELKGRVIGIRKFGTFVELPEGKSGLVHISEVTDNYVENAGDHSSVGDKVEVRVLSIADNGKISLPIRKARDHPCKSRHSEVGHSEPVQKAEGFEKRLSSFLKDSEGRLTSIKRQTKSCRGGKSSRR